MEEKQLKLIGMSSAPRAVVIIIYAYVCETDINTHINRHSLIWLTDKIILQW